MDAIQEALTQGITPAIVVAIYLIIIKIIDIKKENAQSEISEKLVNSITTISNFLNNITDSIISKDKERCRIIITLAFNNMSKEIFLFVRDTIIANNIDKRHDYIVQAISNIITAQYYTVYNQLAVFDVDGHKVSGYCKEQWKDELISSIVKVIFDNNLDKQTKISETETKLDGMISSYITYVENKTFN